MTEQAQPSQRKWLWRILKWGLCGVVLVFVGLRAADLWNKDELAGLNISAGWLVPAVAAYLVGWLPSAWYWRRLMLAMGDDVPPLPTARAYFCGHLGKYIPGKAMVLVIRGGMVKSHGGSAAVGAVTAAFETLLMMGAGLAVGLALFPITGWPAVVADYVEYPWLMPVLVVAGVALALPAISLLLRKFATLMTPRDADGEKSARPRSTCGWWPSGW